MTRGTSSADQPKRDLAADLDKLERVAVADLGEGVHTDTEVLETLRQYASAAAPEASEADIEALSRRMAQRISIDVELGVAVTAKDFKPWLEEQRRTISWDRWTAYKSLLLNKKWSPVVVDKMHELTDTILDFVGDPRLEGGWQRRGLVLGDVQSGKTATYLGLFNKAADAGFRLIVVLAGQTESLRQQTQARIDEGVIGRDSTRAAKRGPAAKAIVRSQYIGVGGIRKDLADAVGMTTMSTDFRLSSLEASNHALGENPSAPFVFVLKKNKSVLNAVHEWLSTQRTGTSKLRVPLLLLDDEADYASINTREEADPTAINQGIRDILALFERASYLGFTATPFANIFIDHSHDEDLFPRDYIYGLESPSNYVGAARIFGRDRDDDHPDPIVVVQDAARIFPPKHRAGLRVAQLPESLSEAIRSFLLSNAVRDLRGQASQPRAMLVNVSRFTNVQAQVHELVRAELVGLKNSIEFHAAEFSRGTRNDDLAALKSTFEQRFRDSGTTWEAVLSALSSSAADIRTRLVNSKTDRKLLDEELSDPAPPRFIAVGGDVLSRGLTLEGLMTSYFYRQVQASDTLLQMARWFGYRDDYEDLCRVWIDADAVAAYVFATDSVAELRLTLRRMHERGDTPADYGLAVQRHPGALMITAKNKMKAAEIRHAKISLRTRSIESPKLPRSVETLDANWRAALKLLDTIGTSHGSYTLTKRQNLLWSDIPKADVAAFMSAFRAHRTNALFAPQLADFIGGTRAADLQTWDVLLVGGKGRGLSGLLPDYRGRPERTTTVDDGPGGAVRVSGASLRVAGREDVAEPLSPQVKAEVVSNWSRLDPGADAKKKSPPEGEFAAALTRPLLLLYPVDPQGQALPADIDGMQSPLLAVKLALPRAKTGQHENDSDDVTYIVNTVAQEQWFTEFSSGDEDDLVVG